ncbi:helix-turn-helix domain-containing protein [bacterium]|nr:helix-turn-helix domain-containing protein [candidate division CSSED10-310 bacterium]
MREPLLTVNDVARTLSLSASAVREMAARGEIPMFKIGRLWRMRRATLEFYIGRIERASPSQDTGARIQDFDLHGQARACRLRENSDPAAKSHPMRDGVFIRLPARDSRER